MSIYRLNFPSFGLPVADASRCLSSWENNYQDQVSKSAASEEQDRRIGMDYYASEQSEHDQAYLHTRRFLPQYHHQLL